jgi:hypothetical protein
LPISEIRFFSFSERISKFSTILGNKSFLSFSIFSLIDDLSLAYSDNDVETTRAKLITSIKWFLSDQCATNAVFNENIEKLRKDLLPKIVENFDILSENEKNLISEMGKFACKLHLIHKFVKYTHSPSTS